MYGVSIELIAMEVFYGLHTHKHLNSNVLNLMLIHFETNISFHNN